MTFSHALSTNNYGPQKFIVSTSSANGTHTTLTAAMAAASSGDTIYLRDSVTENVTITPGVNIVGVAGSALNIPTITGKLTMTGAGTSTISQVQLKTNSDFFLAVTGSAASIVRLENCYLNCSNNTGISYTTSGSGALISILKCSGDVGTTGITLFTMSSTQTLNIELCDIKNSGASSTASSSSAGTLIIRHSTIEFVLSTSGTTTGFQFFYVFFVGVAGTTCLTHNSTLANASDADYCFFASGSASCISIGAGAAMALRLCCINSSNTNAITGSGTLTYNDIAFLGTSSVMNVTTQTPLYSNLGKYKASGQSCFCAYSNTAVTNVTGDATNYTVIFGTELFDNDNNFDGTSTFTAPVTGKYLFTYEVLTQGNLVTHTPIAKLVTTANTFTLGNYGASFAGNFPMTASVIAPMTAGDTATIVVQTANGTKIVGVYGAAGDPRTFFSGMLVS